MLLFLICFMLEIFEITVSLLKMRGEMEEGAEKETTLTKEKFCK